MEFGRLNNGPRGLSSAVLHDNSAFIVAAMLGALIFVELFKAAAPLTLGVEFSDGQWGALVVVAVGFPPIATAISDAALQTKLDRATAASFTAFGLSLTAFADSLERSVGTLFANSTSDVFRFADSTLLGLAVGPEGLSDKTLPTYACIVAAGSLVALLGVIYSAISVRQLDIGRTRHRLIDPLHLLIVASLLLSWSFLSNTGWSGMAQPVPMANHATTDPALWRRIILAEFFALIVLTAILVIVGTKSVANSSPIRLSLSSFALRIIKRAALIALGAALLSFLSIGLFTGLSVALDFLVGIGQAGLGWICSFLGDLWANVTRSVHFWADLAKPAPWPPIAWGGAGMMLSYWLHKRNPARSALTSLRNMLRRLFDSASDEETPKTREPDVPDQAVLISELRRVGSRTARTTQSIIATIPASYRLLAFVSAACILDFPDLSACL